MATVLDSVRMAEPVSRASESDSQPQRSLPGVLEVTKAASEFLKGMPDVREVKVAKAVLMDSKTGTWEVEGEVYVPNATIKMLALPVRKQVLDCQLYILRLDVELNIVAYGRKDTINEREA
jgi:hypothetical protein